MSGLGRSLWTITGLTDSCRPNTRLTERLHNFIAPNQQNWHEAHPADLESEWLEDTSSG